VDTQVAIVGAGPAGLVLSHLLDWQGIDCVVLDNRSRAYVESRIRAGVLEHSTVELLRALGLADRLIRERMVHHGLEFLFEGTAHRIALSELTGGKTITIYGQHELVKDLIKARLDKGGDILFEVSDVAVGTLDQSRPTVRFGYSGAARELTADFVAGCDGFHGICRPSIPAGVLHSYERVYPFSWLGILAQAPPSSAELIYARHERGFALHSMRSAEITRLYLQVAPDETLDDWPDHRIWNELRTRLARIGDWELTTGPVLEKGITPMRSFVAEPMQHRRLFLAGDAAHIVPATGAKGLNLAVADVTALAAGLTAWYASGRTDLLDSYSRTCLQRVWRVQHFSWWMTSMLHKLSDDAFDERLQLSQLRYVTSSAAAATSLAENYVGLPYTFQVPPVAVPG
jgi:p-hydroxybenzoate 3-monooxygenase